MCPEAVIAYFSIDYRADSDDGNADDLLS